MLQRSLGQRHQEPFFEQDEKQHRHDERDRQRHGQPILAQPKHEDGDEQHGRHVDAGRRDNADIDRGRNDHGQNLLDLIPGCEHRAVADGPENLHQVDDAGKNDGEADIKRKEPGAWAFGAPADANPQGADNADTGQCGDGNTNADLDSPVGRSRPTGIMCGVAHYKSSMIAAAA
jgi:hypothetical protein